MKDLINFLYQGVISSIIVLFLNITLFDGNTFSFVSSIVIIPIITHYMFKYLNNDRLE